MSYEVTIYYGDTGAALWSRNITSNVAPMWRHAGCDLAEFDGSTADELEPVVSTAIDRMVACESTFRAMNPSNGWGSYEGCLSFLRNLHDACLLFAGGNRVGVAR